MTSLKKGAPPSRIGLALLRFGLEAPYLSCMSTENTLDSLATYLVHARVSKTDRVWNWGKRFREHKLWSWKILGRFSSPKEEEVNRVHLKEENKKHQLECLIYLYDLSKVH